MLVLALANNVEMGVGLLLIGGLALALSIISFMRFAAETKAVRMQELHDAAPNAHGRRSEEVPLDRP